ncbi:hypothetical protein [Bradyrhizobium sp. Ash2021]|uniref:hypothetical protein n=1 Tax=Bradyrhizobium sp. Ash2021 TaxID=2954771 RepID=UPI002814DC8A|nr:hypothetical protein [Bradyrhizobium sp. Ash2021]WMT75915.1 hypothetical protein NL528_05780 [Bradyrhizobium sp. Ash2021]
MKPHEEENVKLTTIAIAYAFALSSFALVSRNQSRSSKEVIHMKTSFNVAEMGPLASWPIGANAMRSVLALGLLIALSASAEAATIHHFRSRHHVFIRRDVASSFAAVPGWAYEPPRPPIHYNDTPRAVSA